MAEQTNPNLAVVQKFYECYMRHDLETMKREVLAPDVVWLIPGHHPLAGPKRGADEIIAYFQQLAKASFQAEVLSLSASEEYVVDVHRGWGEYTRTVVSKHLLHTWRTSVKLGAWETHARTSARLREPSGACSSKPGKQPAT